MLPPRLANTISCCFCQLFMPSAISSSLPFPYVQNLTAQLLRRQTNTTTAANLSITRSLLRSSATYRNTTNASGSSSSGSSRAATSGSGSGHTTITTAGTTSSGGTTSCTVGSCCCTANVPISQQRDEHHQSRAAAANDVCCGDGNSGRTRDRQSKVVHGIKSDKQPTTTTDSFSLLSFGLDAVYRGCHIADELQGYLKSGHKEVKMDSSPVTLADYSVQALVSMLLIPSEDKLLSEENMGGVSSRMLEDIAAQVASVLPGRSSVDPQDVLDAFFANTEPTVRTLRRDSGSYWVLDPIDGTKGFIRGGQYVIALAYIKDGEPIIGILGCPNLPLDLANPDGPRGSIVFAVKGSGAHMLDLYDHKIDLSASDIAGHLIGGARDVHVRTNRTRPNMLFFESVEAAHSSHSVTREVARRLGIAGPPIRLDSQVKYAILARGDGDLILRLPRKFYKENVWDHAAGALIIAEAGGCVSHADGSSLKFGGRQQLDNQSGLVVSSEVCLLNEAVVVVGSMRPK
eukprot:GHVS01038577.1.p1 GENE.GHVS01038577.1~~GHVS01038577.1.p1  ORF type:complete len:580 (-),score=127.89 GHVS01038577.1:16-1563(-)